MHLPVTEQEKKKHCLLAECGMGYGEDESEWYTDIACEYYVYCAHSPCLQVTERRKVV